MLRGVAQQTPVSPTPVSPPQVSPPKAAQGANITFPWCDPRGRQITIHKGTHFAIPNNGGYFVTQTVGTGTFTTNSACDLKDDDQYD